MKILLRMKRKISHIFDESSLSWNQLKGLTQDKGVNLVLTPPTLNKLCEEKLLFFKVKTMSKEKDPNDKIQR